MPRPDIKVRLAQNEEAPIVQSFFDRVFQMGDWKIDLDAIFPYWLVAEIAGEIVGVLNIRISMPISTLEFLSLDQGLDQEDRRRVTLLLLDSAMAICGANGSQGVSAMVAHDKTHFADFLRKNGHLSGADGTIFFGRIR